MYNTFQGSTLTECTLECTNEKTTLECTNKKNYTQVYTHMSVLREKLHSIECTDGLEKDRNILPPIKFFKYGPNYIPKAYYICVKSMMVLNSEPGRG